MAMTGCAFMAPACMRMELMMQTTRAAKEGPWSTKALEDDARRLAEFERTRIGLPWHETKAWIESWGTPNEMPIPKPRHLTLP
jgi:hypothetical protein